MRELYYPKADRTSQWYGGNSYFPPSRVDNRVDSVVLHTTEGRGWADYKGGGNSPHFTFIPWTLEWRQHIPVNVPAMALRDLSGGTRTNWGGVIQIEIAGTSGWASTENPSRQYTIADSMKSANMSEDAKRALGEFAAWANQEWGVPFVAPLPFLNWNQNGRRFSVAEWDNFSGWTGHARVPENDHSDPGPIDIDAIFAYAQGLPGGGGGQSAPVPEPDYLGTATPFPGAGFFTIGRISPLITLLGERLVLHGWTGYQVGPGSQFTQTDKEAVAWFQRNQGWSGSDADGIPGPVTWNRLMAEPAAPTPVQQDARIPISVAGLKEAFQAHPNGPSSWVSGYVGPVQEMLNKLGFLPTVHTYGHYGTSVVSAVKAYQRSLGHGADGWLGPIELGTLIDQSGFGDRYAGVA